MKVKTYATKPLMKQAEGFNNFGGCWQTWVQKILSLIVDLFFG